MGHVECCIWHFAFGILYIACRYAFAHSVPICTCTSSTHKDLNVSNASLLKLSLESRGCFDFGQRWGKGKKDQENTKSMQKPEEPNQMVKQWKTRETNVYSKPLYARYPLFWWCGVGLGLGLGWVGAYLWSRETATRMYKISPCENPNSRGWTSIQASRSKNGALYQK